MPDKNRATDSLKNVGSSRAYMFVDIGKINPYANNPKKHPLWHIEQIMASIKEFGFMAPVLVDDKYEIIAGHGRYLAALKMGLKKIPIILVSDLSEAQIKAYRIADNQLNQNTGHDQNLLQVELSNLDKMELGFDLEITGLPTSEIDIMLGSTAAPQNDQADIIPEIEGLPVTKKGDLWILGNHILLCGNSLEPSNYKAIMQGQTADAIFTDPPYNVPVSGHVCGNGKIQHDEFAMASGEMSEADYDAFLDVFFENVVLFSKNGSLHYICIDWRHVEQLIRIANRHYSELKNICVWNKTNAGLGSFYRSKHEFVTVFKNGTGPHTNNILLGKHGRYRSNIWDYPGVNSFGSDDLKLHPTVKPVAMIADAIMDCTKRSEIILDPFGGSGSTLIAAEITGRCAHLIELEPKYCDVTIRRWQELTGESAVHAETSQNFNDIIVAGGSDHE